MATSRTQRVGIWIITIALAVGTVGGFIAMIVAPSNEAKDRAALEEAQKEYAKANEEHKKKVDEQAAQLSTKYKPEFTKYSSQVGAFNAEEVKELKTEDLVVGTGAEVKGDTKFAVYYIGWNPKGEIFDQSIDGENLKAPFAVDGPSNTQVITGWKEGLIGMKIGGVRTLTIPADKAYGSRGQGDKIPANTPLKFVVMAIEKPADIAKPEVPSIIKKMYKEKYGIDI